ncbi:hypothetical protein Q7C36_020028 [Tachysurus vachellii]|uniref:Uncharacterized protein n=2 Tax=Tachysurus vachellii TaxID=175792 RepID=A0AA88S573_TACVA|nr:hypothetical protein Q7C36_020028 [Tachysurus vachellii]
MDKGCIVGLAIMPIALLISVCLNIYLFYLKRKDSQSRDIEVPLYRDSFHSDRFEDDERQNQDNPIYGNIFLDGVGGSMSLPEYGNKVQMTKKGTRLDGKFDPEDVSYASLDLRCAQKCKKKKRHQERQNQAHKVQTHPAPGRQMRRIERGTDCDSTLPSRTSSLIVSRSSIYLNSHQVALETEELQREREREKEREIEWKSNQEWEMMKKLHGNFDHSLESSEPSHDQGS